MMRNRFTAVAQSWRWMAVVVFLVDGFCSVNNLSTWKGDWWWGYNHSLQGLPIVLFVVAASVAWDAGRSGNGLQAWARRGPDASWKVPASIGGKPLAVAVGAQLTASLVVVVVTLANHGAVPSSAVLVVAVHLSMTLLAGAVGLAAGARLSGVYAVIAALVAIAVLQFVVPPFGSRVFEYPGVASSVIGFKPSTSYYLVVLVGLLLASLVLFGSVCLPPRRLDRVLAGAIAAVACFAVTSAAIPGTPFVASGVPPTRCGGSEVTVCMYAGYDALVDPLSAGLQQLREMATTDGVNASLLPSIYWQHDGGRLPVGVGVITLDADTPTTGPPSASTLVIAVSTPLWCSVMFAGTPPVTLLKDRQLVADWAALRLGVLPRGQFAMRHKDLPIGSQEFISAVNAALGRMRNCVN
ncbi:MAG: hypothetical protein QM655_11275 [Nocardioidaceae bacterium]